MKILVCVKQVPGSNNVEVDPVTGVLKRSGIPSKCNPYDLYAIEAALSLAERFGGTVETLTMGPPQAKAVIQGIRIARRNRERAGYRRLRRGMRIHALSSV